ncbi:hypothetical protein ATI61_106276 [Archangium gephyra]|uniref:Lipoprotein n=1 Tax=Archangium gephyra TaxID=48 RepID=A0ABX9K090_9BACT|nr:hypothetical protein [Archangium gephyra]REG30806.1 hypothetical protein ATI61_106276 [Archangium gephyra]
MRHVSLPVVLLALASSGCGADPEPCISGCPDISGLYSVKNATPVGQCPFSPYLLAPTVQLQQLDDGRRAVFHVIDPATGLEVPLTGDVYAPGPKEGREVLGSFRIDSAVVRATSASDERTRVLELSASGSVSLHEGRRVLTATMSTLDITNEPTPDRGCGITLSITGEGD